MQQKQYPIAPAALGESRSYRVTGLDMAASWNYAASTTQLTVTLAPDPMTRGWRVRGPHGTLGLLDAEVRGDYPDLERVTTSGFVAATVGNFVHGSQATIDLDVWLPSPVLTVPLNNLPPGAVVLPQGQSILLDTASVDGAEAAFAVGTGQLLVTLRRVGDAAVTVFDDHAIGTFTAPQEFLDRVDESAAAGTPLAARAFIGDGLIAIDADLSDEAVPGTLPELRVDPPPAVAPATESFDLDNWELIVDPELDDGPDGPRQVR